MRLNHYIAKSGYCSRRKAEQLIKNRKVAVNGKITVKPYIDVSCLDRVNVGKTLIKPREERFYLIIDKPKGVTTTTSDPFAAKTVLDIIPKRFHFLRPVGRLDKNSSGLLLLTNDGDLCYQITHPKFGIEKEYAVKLNGTFSRRDCARCLNGIREGKELLKAKRVAVLKSNKKTTTIRVVICEGKKRHLRRMFAAIGFKVLELRRVRLGNLTLKKGVKFLLLPEDTVKSLVLAKT